MRQRKHVLEGKRWVPVDDFDPGPLIYRNDEALGASREARKGPIKIWTGVEVFVLVFVIVVSAPLLEGAFFTFLLAALGVLILPYIIMQWTELRNIEEADFLPRVHERAVIYSYVSYYAHDMVMMPYDQLADVRREGKYVHLVTRPGRKFAIRHWELGDEGFRVLTELFARARAGDYPVAGGGPASS